MSDFLMINEFLLDALLILDLLINEGFLDRIAENGELIMILDRTVSKEDLSSLDHSYKI